jgi:LPXTG-motif cell wall-anchored protein
MKIDTSTGNIYEWDEVASGGTIKDWIISTVDGLASFQGIKDYTGISDNPNYLTYYLVETKVPLGYNLVPNIIKVTFSEDTTTADPPYTYSLDVYNHKGFTLPITGGPGALIFIISGIICVGIAIIILIGSKKKKKSDKRSN